MPYRPPKSHPEKWEVGMLVTNSIVKEYGIGIVQQVLTPEQANKEIQKKFSTADAVVRWSRPHYSKDVLKVFFPKVGKITTWATEEPATMCNVQRIISEGKTTMKITETKLRKIISEEIENVISERHKVPNEQVLYLAQTVKSVNRTGSKREPSYEMKTYDGGSFVWDVLPEEYPSGPGNFDVINATDETEEATILIKRIQEQYHDCEKLYTELKALAGKVKGPSQEPPEEEI